MNYILFDGPYRDNLLPFTYTRPVADIRVGIMTIREKWEDVLKTKISVFTEDYLSKKFPIELKDDNTFINASYLPSESLADAIQELKESDVILKGEDIVAYRSKSLQSDENLQAYRKVQFSQDILTIKNPWDIFSKNGEALQADFKCITLGRKSAEIPKSVNVIDPENIFIEEGVKIEFVTLNASTGPVYIAKDAEIMEGTVIRGPFALCENAIVKMGTKIYGPTTIGPNCKVGGEVNNSVMFANSNKGHEGFLGNSVLGEWCNLGADTNNSNLKNNYAEVRLWSYKTEGFARTGLQFCGLMMGDHSKCGINTMFNTGTVVGVNANIFGSGFPRNFIPSFTWGGNSGFTTYKTSKAYEVAEVVMSRRNVELTQEDKEILDNVFEQSSRFRRE